MKAVDLALATLGWINDKASKIGLGLAWILVALMVASILLQVFMRYVLNNALPWPEEAARALMIWMMALVAAPALRKGDFVAITLLPDSLPSLLSRLLRFVLTCVAVAILVVLSDISIDFFQRGFRTRAASFDLPRAWIYLAMAVCYFTMLFVTIEMALRHFKALIVGESEA